MKAQNYGVKFVGYLAEVVAWRGNAVNAGKCYAKLDFVCGAAFIHVGDGFVVADSRGELAALVSALPQMMQAAVLSEQIHLYRPDIDKDRFVRQITRRFANIEHVLEQAEEIGRTIKRRPYSEFIDEIGATGCPRVEYHGSALLVGGKLVFRPDYKVATIKPLRDGRTYQLLDLDDSLNPSGHGASH